MQATRGVRELTPDSASFLDEIIRVTDEFEKNGDLLTVTEEILVDGSGETKQQAILSVEDSQASSVYPEGGVQQVLINQYERHPEARKRCIDHYGAECAVCGFDFAASYGETLTGFIHVHHLVPLSSVGNDYQVDPINDLRPVCPNCHAVIHHKDPPYSLDDVRELLDI